MEVQVETLGQCRRLLEKGSAETGSIEEWVFTLVDTWLLLKDTHRVRLVAHSLPDSSKTHDNAVTFII